MLGALVELGRRTQPRQSGPAEARIVREQRVQRLLALVVKGIVDRLGRQPAGAGASGQTDALQCVRARQHEPLRLYRTAHAGPRWRVGRPFRGVAGVAAQGCRVRLIGYHARAKHETRFTHLQEGMLARVKNLTEAMTKTQLFSDIAEKTKLTRRQVADVFEALESVIERHVQKGAVVGTGAGALGRWTWSGPPEPVRQRIWSETCARRGSAPGSRDTSSRSGSTSKSWSPREPTPPRPPWPRAEGESGETPAGGGIPRERGT